MLKQLKYNGFLWRLPIPSRTNTKKRCPFHDRGLEYKSRKSRDTWSNRKVRTWSTKWSMTKANRVLPKEHTGHSKHPFQQHMRQLYTWTTPDGQHRNQTDYILCCRRWKSSMLLLLLLRCFSRVWLLATPWTAAYQAPPSMGFSRQEYWSGVPLPSPGKAL